MLIKPLTLCILILVSYNYGFAAGYSSPISNTHHIVCQKTGKYLNCPATIINASKQNDLFVEMHASGAKIPVKAGEDKQLELQLHIIDGATSRVDLKNQNTEAHMCQYKFVTKRHDNKIIVYAKSANSMGALFCGLSEQNGRFYLTANIDLPHSLHS